MSDRFEAENVLLICGDCRDHLPIKADAVITDPPYGMDWGKQSANGFVGGKGGHRVYDRSVIGDDEDFDPSPWLNYQSVILFGANHFSERLPRGTTLVWVKKNVWKLGEFLSDGEIAWEKGGMGVFVIRHIWDGCARESDIQEFYHPTQKPVAVLKWCIERHPDADTVLDPYMGSGTTGIACIRTGRKFIGIEKDPKYFQIAVDRIKRELAQPMLFKPAELVREPERLLL